MLERQPRSSWEWIVSAGLGPSGISRFVVLAVVGLVAHELSTERIVHAFEAIPADARWTPLGRASAAA